MFWYVFSIQNYGNCEWNHGCGSLSLKSAKANLYSMGLSLQKAFFSHCWVLFFCTLLCSSHVTEIKGIKIMVREFFSWPEGIFSRFSSSRWITINYHKMSLRITSATSSLACCFWHIPAVFETGKYEGSPQHLTEDCASFDSWYHQVKWETLCWNMLESTNLN